MQKWNCVGVVEQSTIQSSIGHFHPSLCCLLFYCIFPRRGDNVILSDAFAGRDRKPDREQSAYQTLATSEISRACRSKHFATTLSTTAVRRSERSYVWFNGLGRCVLECVCLFVCVFVHSLFFACLFVPLFFCLFVRLYFCLFACWFVSLFV